MKLSSSVGIGLSAFCLLVLPVLAARLSGGASNELEFRVLDEKPNDAQFLARDQHLFMKFIRPNPDITYTIKTPDADEDVLEFVR